MYKYKKKERKNRKEIKNGKKEIKSRKNLLVLKPQNIYTLINMRTDYIDFNGMTTNLG